MLLKTANGYLKLHTFTDTTKYIFLSQIQDLPPVTVETTQEMLYAKVTNVLRDVSTLPGQQLVSISGCICTVCNIINCKQCSCMSNILTCYSDLSLN